MLREVKNAGYVPRGMWFWKSYAFRVGRSVLTEIKASAYERDRVAQQTQAVPVPVVFNDNGRNYWWCRGRFYWEDEGLSAEDVYALVYERDRRKQRQLERAHAVMATDSLPRESRRQVIPREVRRAVFERDGGRCVECGSNFDLQYDHIIPVALGGASTVANLQLLCASCNQKKGASL